MGSVASLAVAGGPFELAPSAQRSEPCDPAEWPATVAAVRAWFAEVERVLSPYRAGSDLIRWRSGETDLADCSPLLAEVIAGVAPLPEATAGGFHPYDRHGRYDPTGYVKGWAIERGVTILAEHGVHDACLSIGGDLRTIGRADPDRPWRLAIADPADRGRPAAIVVAADHGFALATSGESERGEHIWSMPGPTARLAPTPGRTGTPTRAGLASISVIGPELSLADAYATAIWALARQRPVPEAWEWLEPTEYEALAVLSNGQLETTAGMREHLVGGH